MRFRLASAFLICAVLLPSTTFAEEGRVPAAAWGGLIGGVTAAGATAWGAATYGGNEGGRFCTGCFVHWSTFTVPAGVAIGAGIGFAVDLVRRQTASRRTAGRVVLAPVVTKRGGGVFVSTRF